MGAHTGASTVGVTLSQVLLDASLIRSLRRLRQEGSEVGLSALAVTYDRT
jgi:hypothetical protein